MKECKCYIFSKDEATEILQDLLDDSTTYLKQKHDIFEAWSYGDDELLLDGSQIDEMMSQYFDSEEYIHFAINKENKRYMLVFDKRNLDKE